MNHTAVIRDRLTSNLQEGHIHRQAAIVKVSGES